jgi:hypothetical protein
MAVVMNKEAHALPDYARGHRGGGRKPWDLASAQATMITMWKRSLAAVGGDFIARHESGCQEGVRL